MRGKDISVFGSEHGCRITPAYAGKRRDTDHMVKLEEDHPRLCGEKENGYVKIYRSLGSPPPMRGKGLDKRCTALVQGITPAYAGKSRKLSSCRRKRQDHPRLCGEKIGDVASECTPDGITPAYAGKSPKTAPTCPASRDHPRLCGEKNGLNHILQRIEGSPPPMRGKVHAIATLCRCDGITPAYAGKSGRRQVFF